MLASGWPPRSRHPRGKYVSEIIWRGLRGSVAGVDSIGFPMRFLAGHCLVGGTSTALKLAKSRDQQGGAKPTVPDNQQTGAGKTPDNQQGGGEMVTKTFELTLNGDVPADQAFYVGFKPVGQEGPPFIRVFCGQLGSLGEEEDCEGDGTTYEVEYEFEPGTVLEFAFFRMSESGDSESGDVDNERFHSGVERLDADMTNTAFYTFGTGAGDDQQDDGKDTGAGDDQQEVPDN